MRKRKIEITGNLKKLINLIDLDYKILNKHETLVFLQADLIKYVDKYSQKEIAKLLRISEPAFTSVMKTIKAIQVFDLALPEAFEVQYDSNVYTLYLNEHTNEVH